MSNVDVIITGASGFLGGTLARRLLADGQKVLALGRNEGQLSPLRAMGAQTCAMDLAIKGAWPEQFSAPIMVHCAALSAPFGRYGDFFAANVTGTINALELARAANVTRFVHISSPSVLFKLADQENLDEAHPLPAPVNAYAATKAMAERYVLAATDLDPIILRPRGIYGRGDNALLPRLMAVMTKKPLPLLRNGAAAIDLTHVDDVVDAILLGIAAQGLGQRLFHISGGEVLPITDIVLSIGAMMKITPKWRQMPLAPSLMAAHIIEKTCALLPHRPEPLVTPYAIGLFAFRQSLNISAAQEKLGYVPKINFETGLASLLNEQRSTP